MIIYHLFELVLSRMQGLSNALRQQDLMSQSLLPKRHSTTGDNHHLPALILQHGHLTGHTKTYQLIFHSLHNIPSHHQQSGSFVYINNLNVALPALLLRPGAPVPGRTHPVSPQHSQASLQCVWPASTHCGGQKTFHGDVGARLQRITTTRKRQIYTVQFKEMIRRVSPSGVTKKSAGYLHLACENVLMETGQTFDCRTLDGRREHKASLANMALTPEDNCEEHTHTNQ